MTTFFFACALAAAAWLVHAAVWQVRIPRRQTRAILLIFAGTLAVGLYAGVHLLPGFLDCGRAALFFLACTAAYVVTYSAIEADSPSLAIMLRIARAGAGGIAAHAVVREMSDEVLIIPRIADLVRDGMVCVSDARYLLTPKGRRFVRIFIGWRALLGLPRGG